MEEGFMRETTKTMIEEWAGDCGINVTDKQIKELVDAIGMCSEMEFGSRGFSLGHKTKSDEEKKIEELEGKLHTLERFISSKGHCIDYGVGRVTEHTMTPCGTTHMASERKTTNY